MPVLDRLGAWRVILVLLAVVLIPFALFGGMIARWTDAFLASSPPRALTSIVIGLLLALDFILPIPSSLINTAAGCLLGFFRGTLVALIGMTCSCLAGFWLGSRCRLLAVGKLNRERTLASIASLRRRFGDWIIPLFRPVPVLAEASVYFAGISGMPVGRFAILTFLANLGLAAVYAAVGSWAAGAGSFLLALAGAIILPGLALVLRGNLAHLDGPRTGSAGRSTSLPWSINLTRKLMGNKGRKEGVKDD